MQTCLPQFQSSTPAEAQPSGEEAQEDDAVAWVNAAVGRVFWDFLTESHWAELVSKKIQMKLSKIRVSGKFSKRNTRRKRGFKCGISRAGVVNNSCRAASAPLTCPCLPQLPYFMNELTLTELDMGSTTPRILKASKPSIDYRGKRTNVCCPKHTHTDVQSSAGASQAVPLLAPCLDGHHLI